MSSVDLRSTAKHRRNADATLPADLYADLAAEGLVGLVESDVVIGGAEDAHVFGERYGDTDDGLAPGAAET